MYAIEVDKVSKLFGKNPVLKDISFNVEKGDIHGFLGPNGSGKTTTMRIIAKLLSMDSGDIRLNETCLDNLGSEIYSQIGILLEEPPLYKDMYIEEYLKYILKLKGISSELHEEYLMSTLEQLDLVDVRKRMIGNLSKGYKQRVGIAQAIIHRPSLVILDEPTVGLDPQSVIEIRNLILKLKGQHTILLSSHLLHEMSLVCDQVTIISKGKILESGPIAQIQKKISSRSRVLITLVQGKEGIENELEQLKGVEKVIFNPLPCGSTQIELSINGKEELRPRIVSLLCEQDLQVLEVRLEEDSLEDIFMKVTGER